MVVGESPEGQLQAAVLAPEAIAGSHVDARELDATPTPNRPEQAHHGGHLDRQRDGSDVLVVFLNDFNLPVKEHQDRALPADHAVRLIALIKDERSQA